jgi:prophage antirepressor-like protein
MIKGEPWFVAADVCEILSIENVGNALSRIKKDDIRSADVTDSIGRQQKTLSRRIGTDAFQGAP